MTSLKKFSLDGKETGNVSVEGALIGAKAHSQSIKDYIVAIRANARQWSASTKTRAEVKHTTKKPWKQKGTGRARAGSLVTAQFRGGGIVFGPKPKFDQHVRINKKERQAAIRHLFSKLIKANKVVVIENMDMEAPKTKQVANFLKSIGFARKTLFLGESTFEEVPVSQDTTKKVNVQSNKHENFRKSVSNIPKVRFNLATNISGYDLMLADGIVMTESALEEVKQWLS